MKRIFYLSGALLGVALAVSLTTGAEAGGPVSAGVSLGGSTMTQTYTFINDSDLLDDNLSVLRGALGAYIELSLSTRFSAEIEIIYLSKGVGIESIATNPDSPDALGTVTTEYEIRYLSIPATAGFALLSGPVTPYLFLGPSAEILLSHDDFSGVFENMDSLTLGLQVGAGVLWKRWGANIRYSTDLTNPYNPPPGALLESVKNHGWVGLVTFAVLR